jgi:4-oxalocrotonate tautomerase
MPHVQITWVEGRTPDQKRKIAERVTQVLMEDGRAKRENIHVAFHDLPATNYAEPKRTLLALRRGRRCESALHPGNNRCRLPAE